jgi:hypothetical protein
MPAIEFESSFFWLALEELGVSRRKSFSLVESFLRKMMTRITVTMRRAPIETPTPMPTLSSVDSEDGGLEDAEMGGEDGAAERILGPTNWLVLGVVCRTEIEVGEEVRGGVVGVILELAVEVDDVIGVYCVRLKGIAFIERRVLPHP